MASSFTNATTYSVSSYIEIAHSYHFVNHVFDTEVANIADLYKPYKRCLAIVDHSVHDIYGYDIKKYFKAYEIEATIRSAYITEDKKSLEASLAEISRLLDLHALSIVERHAVNWYGMKNRLGGYHGPLHTIIDPTFLRTLPEAEIRNGIAEILKISSCTHIATFEALEQYGHTFIETHFGHSKIISQELMELAENVIRQGKRPTEFLEHDEECLHPASRPAIQFVLEVEVPNSREQCLDRVMYFGHTWSPVLELAVSPPLLHGHAISVDMCFSATLANQQGLLPNVQYMRFLDVFSKLGLALDHPAFTLDLMKEGSQATIATRDGKLRAPVPTGTLGSHAILQMVDGDELEATWASHKEVMKQLPRKGLGLDMDVALRAEERVAQLQETM